MVKMPRSFIFKNPDEYGMEGWHDLSIPSDDGTPLEAWYIPAKGGESDKLVIFNHALPMYRAGYPGHMGEPWSNFVESVEIDFVIQYKHLTDAGYNVLTYDFRNHGQRGPANGGVCGLGRWEWRDCVGVKTFVDTHPHLGKMKVALFSQCLGGVSQYAAIAKRPELVENVTCLCSPLVPNMASVFGKRSRKQGIGQYQELIDLEIMKLGGFPSADMSGKLWAPNVKLPVLMWQVRDDAVIDNPTDAQSTFDALGSNDKELHWIEARPSDSKMATTVGPHPEKALAFFDEHMN
jgi:pimeloyl-ACP methyl ester carboxylesterase